MTLSLPTSSCVISDELLCSWLFPHSEADGPTFVPNNGHFKHDSTNSPCWNGSFIWEMWAFKKQQPSSPVIQRPPHSLRRGQRWGGETIAANPSRTPHSLSQLRSSWHMLARFLHGWIHRRVWFLQREAVRETSEDWFTRSLPPFSPLCHFGRFAREINQTLDFILPETQQLEKRGKVREQD